MREEQGNVKKVSTQTLDEKLMSENGTDTAVEKTEDQVVKKPASYVKISDDKDSAWLCVEPKDDGEYTKEELISFLKANGVQAGFHESNIAALCKKKIYRREVLAAKGRKPGEGKDGYFDFFISTEDYSKHPKINSDGSVDYMSMSLIYSVEKGDLIAEYHHAVRGTAGYDVCGKFFPPNQ